MLTDPNLHRFDTDQWCDGQTDEQTDASTMAKMCKALHAVARKKRKVFATTNPAERGSQLDKWHRWKRSFRIHFQRSSTQTIEIAHDNQQVRRRLDRQKPSPWYVHTCHRF